MTGRRIGRFELLDALGRGGSATVYRARDHEAGRDVAVKLLGREVSPATAQRFRREAALLALLDHPHIVPVLGAYEEEDHLLCALPYLPGGDLGELLAAARELGEPLGPTRALPIARDLLAALHYLEGVGICHRDIKPGNVLLDHDGRAALADFGLAHLEDLARLTGTGDAVGTVRYMSPEQLRGDPVDNRSDLYQVGLLLHEMLVGDLPFPGEDAYDQARARAAGPLAPDLDPAIPHAGRLGELLARACSPDPEARPPTAQAFLEELEALRPAPARRVPLLAPTPEVSRRLRDLRDELAIAPGTLADPLGTTAVLSPGAATRRHPLALVLAGTLLGAAAAGAFRVLVFPPSPYAAARVALREAGPRAAARELEALLANALAAGEELAFSGEELDLLGTVLADLGAEDEDRFLRRSLLQITEGSLELPAAPGGRVGAAVARDARALVDAGRRDRAEELLDLAEACGARDAAGILLRAELARENGEGRRALHLLERLLEREPDHQPARLLLASIARDEGLAAMAEGAYRSLLDRRPGDPAAALGLAGMLAARGDAGAAREAGALLDSLAARDLPEARRRDVEVLRARLEEAAGRLEDALTRVRALHALEPTRRTWLLLARLYRADGQGHAAGIHFNGALRAGATDPEIALEVFRRAALRTDTHAMEESLGVIRGPAPALADALGTLAARMRTTGTTSAALVREARAVLALRPGEPLAFTGLGQEAVNRGAYAEARGYLDQALAGIPDAAAVHLLDAALRARAGAGTAEVVAAYGRVLRADPRQGEALGGTLSLWIRDGAMGKVLDLLARRRREDLVDTALVVRLLGGLLAARRYGQAIELVRGTLQVLDEEEATDPGEPGRVRRTQERGTLRPILVQALLQAGSWGPALEVAREVVEAHAPLETRASGAHIDNLEAALLHWGYEECRQVHLLLKLLPTVGIGGIRVNPAPPDFAGERGRRMTRLEEIVTHLAPLVQARRARQRVR